jgi:uncharacterized RDD family membrane protein YckC
MTDPAQATTQPPAPTTANLLRRLMALLYDAFLLFAITLGYGGVLLLIKIIFNGIDDLETVQPGLLLQILSFVGWMASLAGYYFICWRKQGQTLGMKAWRLKLQNSDGTPASPEQCIKRSIFACFSLGLLGVGYLICLIPSRKTCLHDDLSNTEVVVLEKQK